MKGYYIKVLNVEIPLGKYLDLYYLSHLKATLGPFTLLKLRLGLDAKLKNTVYDSKGKEMELVAHICEDQKGIWVTYPQGFEGYLLEPEEVSQ